MIKRIAHTGMIVSDLDKSINFYENILGLEFKGRMLMEGAESEALFGIPGVKAEVAYLAPSSDGGVEGPLLELICLNTVEGEFKIEKNVANFSKAIIAEVCFETDDIEEKYKQMKNAGVKFISAPQTFDYSSQNMGVSKAAYFYDPDGIIQELLEVGE